MSITNVSFYLFVFFSEGRSKKKKKEVNLLGSVTSAGNRKEYPVYGHWFMLLLRKWKEKEL